MISLNEVIELVHNPLSYEQKLVSVINDKGEQIPLSFYKELYDNPNSTVKVEGMERYNSSIYNYCNYYKLKYHHPGPVTCHAFIAKENSPSFNLHTDPDDVIIHCCDGIKTLLIDDSYKVLKEGDYVFIPANTPHKALNEHSSLILSFGLEKFLVDKAKYYELDVISKNDRNL